MREQLAAAVLAAWAAPALAAVTDVGPGGFTLVNTAHVAATPHAVYAALIQPQRWWDGAHSFSHDAANLSLVARAGGCWCEKLPGGGSAEHMQVLLAMPDHLLRLSGALGPMQAWAVEGVMTWSLKPAAAGTDLELTYTIGGYVKGGMAAIAPVADSVLAGQLIRLKALVETGHP